jgi:cell division transport system permease protein
MIFHFTRALRFTSQSVWRNVWLASTTVATIILTVLSINLAVAIHLGVDQIIQSAKDKVNLTVHFYPDTTSDQVRSTAEVAQTIPGVNSAVIISKEDVLQDYIRNANGDPDLLKPLEVLGENPFGPSLVVYAGSIDVYEKVLDELDKPAYANLIESQRKLFEENRRFITSFTQVSERVQTVSLGISSFFAIVTLLLVYNTIRIAIYSHRKEIAVMRLVGATNWFIRAPFLLEVALYALLAVLIGTGLFVACLYAIEPHLQSYFGVGVLSLYPAFMAEILPIVVGQFVALLVLSLLSCAIAIRRYLKV